ncbi:hypothetical protein CXB51_005134 [Gossypium anomalum]|uniref:Peroxiredoxin-like 2A n=1 Tax=Gossypium anomalum TaxID=47600 RepID=A0A8J5ZMB9_9ROSI|nr:hypothetical protein CXB51_005134 [Gossypium anomalum]
MLIHSKSRILSNHSLFQQTMASFSIEDFVGDGVLKELIPSWDDVPTLKIMNPEDMDAINMTQHQKDALEIRTYLHDRALMQYGDKLEASRKSLPELLNLSTEDLSSQFGMKRGHIARFTDRNNKCTDPLPKSYGLPPRKLTKYTTYKMQTIRKSFCRSSTNNDRSLEESLADFKIKDGYIFKGIVAAGPAEPRACVQRLTPEYKIGMERLVKTKTPPMKASELWRDKPAVLLCIRRPGCIMCRAEAHQLYAKRPIFDALGIQMFAVLHEHIESEISNPDADKRLLATLLGRGCGLRPDYGILQSSWMGGKLLKDKFLSGFVFNPRAIANYKRAKSMGIEQNFKGEGEIKGGLFIVGPGGTGIAYQFIERNFGDWAPVAEVVEICARLKNQQQDEGDSSRSPQEHK